MTHPYTHRESQIAAVVAYGVLLLLIALLAWFVSPSYAATWLHMDGPAEVYVGDTFDVNLSISTDWISPYPHDSCLPMGGEPLLWWGTLDAWDMEAGQGYVLYNGFDVAGPWSDRFTWHQSTEPHWGYCQFTGVKTDWWSMCDHLHVTATPTLVGILHLQATVAGVVDFTPDWGSEAVGGTHANTWSEHPCDGQNGGLKLAPYCIVVLPPRGDCNGDGVLDCDDINPFVAALNSGDPCADMNGDGVTDFADINPFVEAL